MHILHQALRPHCSCTNICSNQFLKRFEFKVKLKHEARSTGQMRHFIFVLIQVVEFLVLKSENAYSIPNFRCRGRPCKTNLPSNTAFRGFGFPQATVVVEAYIKAVASKCNLLPEEVSCQILLETRWWHRLVCISSTYNLYIQFQENKTHCSITS